MATVKQLANKIRSLKRQVGRLEKQRKRAAKRAMAKPAKKRTSKKRRR